MEILLAEELWLPRNVSWFDVRRNLPVSFLPQQIVYASVAFVLTRLALDCLVLLPLARRHRVVPNKEITELWSIHLSGETFDSEQKFKKASEGLWKLGFFTLSSLFGVTVMSIEELWFVMDCLRNWPSHVTNCSTKLYLIFETAFRLSLLFSSVVFDVRRRDFPQSLLHHVLAVGLLVLSFALNLLRIAVPILVAHNIADIFLESAQLARLFQKERALRVLFVCTLISWVVTRLLYFPFWILHSAFFDAPFHLKAHDGFWSTAPVYRLLVVMLAVLAGLHLFWSLILAKVTWRYCSTGALRDLRDKNQDSRSLQKKQL